jgi:DNA-binding HxlR family transcriptional regulator
MTAVADPGNQFDASRAELFEALGHPMRVKILNSLEGRQMGFAELKREVGIESSGHLQFHLSKLSGLVATTAGGDYMLSDDGREAIRVLRSTRANSEQTAPVAKASSLRRIDRRTLLLTVLVAVVVLASVAIYQQDQIAAMNRTLSSETVSIGGTKYYYENIPVLPNGTRLLFHGVTFTTLQPIVADNYTYAGSVRLTNGTLLSLSNKTIIVEEMGLPIGMSVRFPDSSQVTFPGFNVTAKLLPANDVLKKSVVYLTYSSPLAGANPWFAQLGSLRVGLFMNFTNFAYPMTVYVGANA